MTDWNRTRIAAAWAPLSREQRDAVAVKAGFSDAEAIQRIVEGKTRSTPYLRGVFAGLGLPESEAGMERPPDDQAICDALHVIREEFGAEYAAIRRQIEEYSRAALDLRRVRDERLAEARARAADPTKEP